MRTYQGNPKQEQTNGKKFISAGYATQPKVGDYYVSLYNGDVCLCENENFPEDTFPRIICKPYISLWKKVLGLGRVKG